MLGVLLIFLIPIVLTLVFFIWLQKITHPTITIQITPTEIHVGDLQFDRADFHGFRTGNSESSGEGDKSSWTPDGIGHNQLMWTALRPQIGRWGEELPYMVPKTVAHDYVIWLNEVAAHVGAPAPKQTAPEEGRREQRF